MSVLEIEINLEADQESILFVGGWRGRLLRHFGWTLPEVELRSSCLSRNCFAGGLDVYLTPLKTGLHRLTKGSDADVGFRSKGYSERTY